MPTISKPHIEGYNISDERLVFGEWQREPNHKEIREFLAALAVRALTHIFIYEIVILIGSLRDMIHNFAARNVTLGVKLKYD